MAMRGKLFERIEEAICDWDIAPVHASVFGSTARGDGDLDSDVDLLIVHPPGASGDERWQAQVDELRDQIEAWTGNRANIVDRSETQLAELVRQQRPIVAELRSDAIVIAGHHCWNPNEPARAQGPTVLQSRRGGATTPGNALPGSGGTRSRRG